MAMSKRTASRALLVMTATVVILHRTLCVAASPATPVTAPPATKQTRTPALFLFGDSIVDTGNNNGIITTIRCNFAPYGQDFPGHNATGRFSNGKVPGDIVASRLGIKEYVPAYLGTELSDFDLLTGVSFASGGCGFDPLTAELVSVLTMDNQLDLFKEYKEKLKRVAGAHRAADIVSTSLYLVITGTDDLANTYFTTPFRRDYDLESYIEFVVYNAALEKEIKRLNGSEALPGSVLKYIDLYTPLLDMIQRPDAYGFDVTNRGCCGTGVFEVTLTCNRYTAEPCGDPSKFLFWDTYHLTERGYNLLMAQIINRYGM